MWQDYKDDELTPEDRQKLRLTHNRMDQAWPIIGPIVAAVSNWKAWVAILAFVIWINNPKIIAALSVLTGVDK